MALDNIVEFLSRFSTQERHYLKVYRDSSLETYIEMYFYPAKAKFEVLGENGSQWIDNCLDLYNYLTPLGYDPSPLEDQLMSLLTVRIAHADLLLAEAKTAFGQDMVDSSIAGWAEFGKGLRDTIEKLTIRKNIKAVD